MEQKKKDPRRWIIAILSICYIAWMWVKKDLLSIYANLPKEQALPLMLTTAAVSLLKVAALAGIVLLIKWLAGKLRKGRS